MLNQNTHEGAKSQLSQRLFTAGFGVKQHQKMNTTMGKTEFSRPVTSSVNGVATDNIMGQSSQPRNVQMSMSMSSNNMPANSYKMGDSFKKGASMSGTNYANVRPNRLAGSNINMSLGGQTTGAAIKRNSYRPSMVMGQNRIAAVPNSRRNQNATIMMAETNDQAEDFKVEGEAPVVKDDHMTKSLSEMTSMERVRHAQLITAIKTPYTKSGRIDLNAYDKLIHDQIAAGVDGIIVAGTTGEGHLMNWDENLTLIEYCAAEYGDKLCIIGNTGSNSTREMIKATKEGFEAGMHGALQINPYYGKSSAKGVKFHFDAAMEYGPAVIYNVASRTAQDITPDIVEHLAKNPNFAGMKECGGHDRIKQYSDKGILCWSGNDDECHDSKWQYGGHGVISVTSNVLPGVMRRLMDTRDDELNAKVMPLMNWLFLEPNPIGLNTISAMTGAAQPVFRAPYMPYDLDKREAVIDILSSFQDYEIQGPRRPIAMDDGDFKVLTDWARGVCKVKEDFDGAKNY